MIEVHEGTLDVNGWKFRTLSAGPRDAELILLLHGFPQFADAWREIMLRLADAGFHAVAVDQRGYSPGARPKDVDAYGLDHLVEDAFGFADALGADRFHIAGHDWGAVVAWVAAARRPDRLGSISALSVPHVDAFLHAVLTDPDQMWKSKYIAFFKLPGHLPEKFFLADDAKALRAVYQGKVGEDQVQENVRRLSEPGALTAALNWYRALRMDVRIGKIAVPTLYVWSDEDMALGETAAKNTRNFVDGPYRFERMNGYTHWLLDEAPEQIATLILERVQSD